MVIQRNSKSTLSRDVLYIGSAVPMETSEGLEAVQQPLRSRYPRDSDENIQGILSTISIIPSGIQLQYKNDPTHVVLFPFSALTMCAAVRCVNTMNVGTGESTAQFVSLTSPEAGGANSQRPAIFTAITRRTKGRQVLECHGFVTMSPKDALDLVQWTSVLDRRSKYVGIDRLASQNYSTHETRADFIDTASLPDFPIQLVPGEPIIPNTSPAFYQEPPPHGYFYSTKQAQVKKYSLEKFQGGTVIDETSSVLPSDTDHTARRPGYSASNYSTSAAGYPIRSRQSLMVPKRVYPLPLPPPPPSMISPVLVGASPHPSFYPYQRAHIFPRAPLLRVRPVPVFVPPPLVYDQPHKKAPELRRESRGSSRSSSTSSVPDLARRNRKPRIKVEDGHDDSSESSIRPRTPPTDYDNHTPRASRKDEFYRRHNLQSDHPQAWARKDYRSIYVLPPNGYFSPPAAILGRPRSVPPYGQRAAVKGRNKKKKSKKRTTKKSSRGEAHNESTDSVGYASEMTTNAENKQPRDFRRLENQFKHERAFSKSLTEETRHTPSGTGAFNAYSLNNTEAGGGEEFPMY